MFFWYYLLFLYSIVLLVFLMLKFFLVLVQNWVCRQLLLKFDLYHEISSSNLLLLKHLLVVWVVIYGILEFVEYMFRPFWLSESPLKSHMLFQCIYIYMLLGLFTLQLFNIIFFCMFSIFDYYVPCIISFPVCFVFWVLLASW